MKINHTTPVVGTTTTTGPSVSEQKEKTATKPAVEELQSTNVRKALQESSDVDMNKVSEVRKAIANGELKLDVDSLAEAVVSMHRR